MAVIELLYRIEEAFDLQIPDQDLVGHDDSRACRELCRKAVGKIGLSRPNQETNEVVEVKG